MMNWTMTGQFRAAPLPDGWRDDLAQRLGARPRRIGLWAEMVLYGALRCMADAGESGLPAGAVLMLASRKGTHAARQAALEQMHQGLPMPTTFLQTQPSQVLAQLAECLVWRGQACFVTGADLAAVRLLAGSQAGSAGMLIGLVDDEQGGMTDWQRWRGTV